MQDDRGTIELGLGYDMRAPDFGTPAVELYKAALEQCAWADRHGFATVTLSEHHAGDDGYLPSPIVMGAAVAGVTERMRIKLSLVLLPLYNPIRAAEDLAVLDLVSGGRLELVVGLGYRPVEYEVMGVNMKRRPSLMDEAVEVLKQAWTGEEFAYRGQTVRVLPRPAQRPRPRIAMGGASPASARRAAAIADDYFPLAPRLYELYLEELERLGRPKPPPQPRNGTGGAVFLHVAEDPDAAWARIAPHAVHETNAYGRWAVGMRGAVYEPVSDPDDLRTRGTYKVVTPAEAVELARTSGALTLKPLMGGMDPDLGWESLQLVVDEVLPALAADGIVPAAPAPAAVASTSSEG